MTDRYSRGIDTPRPARPPVTGVAATLAPVLLLLSVVARLAVTYLMPNGTNFIDLHVYVDGSAALDQGRLYSFVYHPPVPPLPLMFTYPPFAALVFYPLHFLPFWLVALCWQVGIVAALFGCAVVTLKLLDRYDVRSAMAWTAVAIWFEPMRHVFELGQIGVVLMLAVLAAVYSRRNWLSGVLLGLAAGVKLTPAVAGLYFLGARRWGAVAVSAVVFACTVGISVLLLGGQGRFYFTDLLGDADRIGVVGKPDNQSLRGVIGYAIGHDGGYGPLVLGALALATVLSALAWRAIASDDRLGRIVIVMLFGLLISPISWTHHWVWVLPLTAWLLYGSLRERTRAVGWAWLALSLVSPPWILAFTDSRGWTTSSDWYLVWLGALYVLAALVTLAYLATLRRGADRDP